MLHVLLTSSVEVILLFQSCLVRVQQFPFQCPQLTLQHFLVILLSWKQGWGLSVTVTVEGGWHMVSWGAQPWYMQDSPAKGRTFLLKAQQAPINFFSWMFFSAILTQAYTFFSNQLKLLLWDSKIQLSLFNFTRPLLVFHKCLLSDSWCESRGDSYELDSPCL